MLNKLSHPTKETLLRPCTATQLAAAYGVSTKVLKTWLRGHEAKIGRRKGYYYNLEQLFIIIDIIGFPVHSIGKDPAIK